MFRGDALAEEEQQASPEKRFQAWETSNGPIIMQVGTQFVLGTMLASLYQNPAWSRRAPSVCDPKTNAIAGRCSSTVESQLNRMKSLWSVIIHLEYVCMYYTSLAIIHEMYTGRFWICIYSTGY